MSFLGLKRTKLNRTDIKKYRKKGFRTTPPSRKSKASKILMKSEKGKLRLTNYTISKAGNLFHNNAKGFTFDYKILYKKKKPKKK